MGLIPFIGDDSKDDEDGFNSKFGRFADKTNLSRGEQKDPDEEVAEMHKSRSRKAFQENDQFSGSSGEWRKVTDSENSFSETDRGPTKFQDPDDNKAQQKNEELEPKFNNQNRERRKNEANEGNAQELAEGFEEMDKTLQETVEEASKVKEEFKKSEGQNRKEVVEQEENENEKGEATQKESLDSQEKDSIEKQEVADSLENNISQIKSQIESGNVSRKGLEDVASRFEELVDRLEDMDDKESEDEDTVSDEFKEDVREDLGSFQDELLEMREKQETLDNRYQEIESAVIKASEEEEDVRVEDINTVERLDELEDEVEELKSGEVTEASNQVHMEALENEVKDLRKDVRELSEAVVTISEKVFR